MSRPASRQELYDQIRQSSRDEVILNEMIRLGFWKDGSSNQAPADLIKRKGQIRRELNELMKQQRLFSSKEDALKEIHRIRKEESLKRRAELKQQREEKKAQQAANWQKRKTKEILYLGPDVSNNLAKLKPNPEKLTKYNLPDFPDHIALAEFLNISLADLKFLSYARKVSKVNHYKRFLMPKKSGGYRQISAPQPRLKDAQLKIYLQLLNQVKSHPAANGFLTEKSIVTNATPHVGADVVMNLDLKDFFPSLTLARVIGAFRELGYSHGIASVLALICTEQPTQEVSIDNENWHIADGQRCLPQGAPTSPAITNIICRRLDARLQGIANKHSFSYTRYADDMTFSTKGETKQNLTKLLWHVKKVIHEEGFTVHPDKLRIMHKGQHQEVTGVVVNDKISISRTKVRQYRALLHHLNTKGPAGATWDGKSDRLLARALGYGRFLVMIDRERFTPMLHKMETLAKRHGYQQQIKFPNKQNTVASDTSSPPLTPSQPSFIKKLITKLFRK
ncbi:MAG: reverse transcriptase domain-containing protein [Akkermansiaceae bacterium]